MKYVSKVFGSRVMGLDLRAVVGYQSGDRNNPTGRGLNMQLRVQISVWV